jgi:hypothetical protein
LLGGCAPRASALDAESARDTEQDAADVQAEAEAEPEAGPEPSAGRAFAELLHEHCPDQETAGGSKRTPPECVARPTQP